MCVTLSNEVLSVNSSGTDVVLARFPPSGDLTSFGLTPSVIKSIAIPNDIQEWPTTALNGCTNLEEITVYGEAIEGGTIILNSAYNLKNLTNLKAVQLPSTVTRLSKADYHSGDPFPSTFPPSLQKMRLPKTLTLVGEHTFFVCLQLSDLNIGDCERIECMGWSSINGASITTLDLSKCKKLKSVREYALDTCAQLTAIVFPVSLCEVRIRAFGNAANIQTIIWRGEKAATIATDAFNSFAGLEIVLHETA